MDALDGLFREAVAALDAGDLPGLEAMLARHAELAAERLEAPGEWLRARVGDALDGFFRAPYLLWFVAEDPVRTGRLPANIGALAAAIIRTARAADGESLQEQLDYALKLVSWSWIARECGVQIDLIDVLMDAGASPHGNPENALVNDNRAAAEHLLARGARPTLASALCLHRWDEAARLEDGASEEEKRFALTLCALRGEAEAIRRLLRLGVDVNRPSEHLYSHASPLHHAVCSGDLASVRLLFEAGADARAVDTVWQGTPLGWAEHYAREHGSQDPRAGRYAEIAAFLRELC